MEKIKIEGKQIFVTFKLNGGNCTVEAEMTPEEVEKLMDEVNCKIRYPEDIRQKLDEMVASGSYTDALLDDKDLEAAVLYSYATYREEHSQGSDVVWGWEQCLDEALKDHKEALRKYAVDKPDDD